MARQIILPFTE